MRYSVSMAVKQNINSVDALERMMLQDVRDRGLLPGDKYLTASEAQELFGVRTTVVNDAMRRLAERNILVRQRRSGTFIGPAFHPDRTKERPALDHIHVMMAMDYYRTGVLNSEVFVGGLAAAVPGTHVHVRYIAEHDTLGATRQILDQNAVENSLHGYVMVRSDREVQQHMAQCGSPVVVFGSVYPGVDLPSIDIDWQQASAIIAKHLITQGRRKIALITRSEWRRGDNLILESLTANLSEAGLGMNALQVRSIPTFRDQIIQEVSELMAQPEPPTAMICISDFYTEAAQAALKAIDDDHARKVELICNARLVPSGPESFTYVASTLRGQQQVERVGQMLADIALGRPVADRHIRVPVEIHHAASG